MKAPFLTALALLLSFGTLTHGQTIISASSTAPTSGPLDISQFNSSGSPNGSQDYTNNLPLGQTFTTLGSPSGYLLNSITLQGGGGAGDGYQNNDFTLTLYTISGTALTPILPTPQFFTFADRSGATSYANDYLTLNLTTPIILAADTQYAFTFSNNGSSAYFGFAESSSNSYAGGAAFNGTPVSTSSYPASTMASNLGSVYGYDRSFDVGLTEVPEPTSWAMVLGGVAVLLAFMRIRRLV